MYANRRSNEPRVKPGSLAAAIAINGAALAALIYSAPQIFVEPRVKPLTTFAVPPEPIPDPIPAPEPLAKTRPLPRQIDKPLPLVDAVPSSDDAPFFTGPVEIGSGDARSGGTGTNVAIDPPPPPPVLVDPSLDQRFAGSFQPDYPADERRAEREGVVLVRVLIGIDGRVKQVAQISATSDSFYRATMRRALAAWRFKPGTRNGIPVERWREIRVSFHLQEG